MSFVEHFRGSAPYIHSHRGGTFVILISGEAIRSKGLWSLVQDIALLHGLGIRLVLVAGARAQVERRLKERGHKSRYASGFRITDEAALECVKDAVGSIRVELEALLSMGLPNTPMAGARVRVATGNFVSARPVGVVQGQDMGHTGRVRRIDGSAIGKQLEVGNVVLLAPIGYSPTGEVFNLSAEDVAAHAAVSLSARKLICLTEGRPLTDHRGRKVGQLPWPEAEEILKRRKLPDETRRYLAAAVLACRHGVDRAHLVPRKVDGCLLVELFTREGIGTLVSSTSYENVRAATSADVGGIFELIEPLEREGILRRRTREMLESDVNHFTVIERDGLIEACAALYLYPEADLAEVACLAVRPDCRGRGFGDMMLDYLEGHCRERGIHRLFVMTTQSAHWFIERSFRKAKLRDLPAAARSHYTTGRRSQVLIKSTE